MLPKEHRKSLDEELRRYMILDILLVTLEEIMPKVGMFTRSIKRSLTQTFLLLNTCWMKFQIWRRSKKNSSNMIQILTFLENLLPPLKAKESYKRVNFDIFITKKRVYPLCVFIFFCHNVNLSLLFPCFMRESQPDKLSLK